MGISADPLNKSIGQLPQGSNFPPLENSKSKELVLAMASIFTSIFMLPVDRIFAKKIVGQLVTKTVLYQIAKQPFLGVAPRLTNSVTGSCLTFGTAAIFHEQLKKKYPNAPYETFAISLAGGTVIEKAITSPLATLLLRMQIQDKKFFNVLTEIFHSQRPIKSLYAGTTVLLIRDFLYVPVCIPLAEKLKATFSTSHSSSLTLFFQSTLAFSFSGTAASLLSHPFQYIGISQKNNPHPIRQIFAKTFRERGVLGFYRGFKLSTGRLFLYNCFFGSAIYLGERLFKRC
ncbi:MAG TPA: MC/SLC25 family protein [Rhabdochlamydiaceae bacterium]|nr:MC/SLC25 family protein [Rhabdochlamydiaceae bacterium]